MSAIVFFDNFDTIVISKKNPFFTPYQEIATDTMTFFATTLSIGLLGHFTTEHSDFFTLIETWKS